MADTKTVQIAGHGRPSLLMRRIAHARHGKNFALSIDSMIEDATAVNALAALLDRAFNHALSPTGSLDLKEAAIFMIREMRRSQR
jgi:hypothetical protein